MVMKQADQALGLAHVTSSSADKMPRARLRTHPDGMTAITTMDRGTFRTVLYTPEERTQLLYALQSAWEHRNETYDIDWGKDRDK